MQNGILDIKYHQFATIIITTYIFQKLNIKIYISIFVYYRALNQFGNLSEQIFPKNYVKILHG